MVLSIVTSTIEFIFNLLKEHKLIAVAMSIFILAILGTTVNFFLVGQSYSCDTNNVTGETKLYDVEDYNKCIGTFLQGKFYKFNYSKTDCDNAPSSSNSAWKEACYELVTNVQKTNMYLDVTIPFVSFYQDFSSSLRDLFSGENQTVEQSYNNYFESNICTKLYSCMRTDKAESIGLFDGCKLTKGYSQVDDFPTIEEFESVTKVEISYESMPDTFEKNNIFRVNCFGFGQEKTPSLSLFGLIPIFDWKFIALITLLSYWCLFMFWLADNIGL